MPHRHVLGFTLIELLVVLVLISVLITLAVGAVGGGGQQARVEQEVKRLDALLRLAGEEAVLQGQELGIAFTPEGYRFLLHDGEQWQEMAGDELYRAHTLPNGVNLELFIEDLPVALKSDAGEPDEEEAAKAQVVVYSSGERTPFVVIIASEDESVRYRLEAEPLGDPQWALLDSLLAGR